MLLQSDYRYVSKQELKTIGSEAFKESLLHDGAFGDFIRKKKVATVVGDDDFVPMLTTRLPCTDNKLIRKKMHVKYIVDRGNIEDWW